jgi:hypothetical protein
MDDFIKILIWVIIIISFFSSIFKKKKKEKLKQGQTPQHVPDMRSNIPPKVEPQGRTIENKEEIDSYNEMLAEIESLFKKDQGSTMSGTSPEQDSAKAKTSDKTKIQTHESGNKIEKYDPQWHKETESEHTMITDWEKEEKTLEKKAKADFNIENQAKNFEKMINKKSEPIGIFKHTIKEKLSNPATLKDYILMSEIIGKPKAMRR